MRRGVIVAGTLLLSAVGIWLIDEQSAFAVARLVVCFLIFLSLVTAAWGSGGSLRNGLVVASSLTFGLMIIEGVTLAFGLRPKLAADDTSLTHARPIVGWGPTKPGVFDVVKKDAAGHTIYKVKVTIDDHLNRKTNPSSGPGGVAFFGDSFIFGDGVEDNGTLPQIFAELNNRQIPVQNLAFPGWSPAQNLAALQADLYEPVLDKPRHFVLFTSTFHIERTACRGAFAFSAAPRYVLESGALREAGSCVGWKLRLLEPAIKFAQGFALFQRAFAVAEVPTKADVETYIRIVEAFVATAKQKFGVNTTVLFWPRGDEPLKGTGYTEAEILAALRKANCDIVIDPLPDADDGRYRIVGDGHPTALANQSIAYRLLAHLREIDPQALATNEPAH